MSTSPSKPLPPYLAPTVTPTTLQPSSPRAHRTIRRLQSAQTLSSNPPNANTPSLISQQRQQQQQRHISGFHRDPLPAQNLPISTSQPHHRSRSNSDAAVMSVSNSGPAPRRNAVAKKIVAPPISAKHQLEALIRDGPPKGDLAEGLRDLRYYVLSDGVEADNDGMSSLRIYIWLILLNAPPLATDHYLDLIHRGPSPAYAKIRNDTFRTLATDPLFKRRVSEASLIRLLNAIAWRLHDAKTERSTESGKTTNTATEEGSPELHTVSPIRKQPGPPTTTTDGSEAGATEPGIYVQGMNVLCAPFLYAARSEAEAFIAFYRFLTRECPGYVRGAMDGVHKGLALVDKCLSIVDYKLSDYLHSKGMHAELYAFPSVLTLCACTPPLPEVLQLWDFLFAHGAHLNILCIVAQLVMIRDTILSSPRYINMHTLVQEET
ncbi:MAG: hypothetical protein M1830_010759, partial [Pleopsidium flavum]